MSNRTVLDLNKVQWAKFFWQNQYGDIKTYKPKKPTLYGCTIDTDSFCMAREGETREKVSDRIKRLGREDRWFPTVVFQLAANHNVTFTGDKANIMWQAWGEKIFNK
jgi:hypothetical protein